MSVDLARVLAETAGSAFEQLAFLMVDPDPADPADGAAALEPTQPRVMPDALRGMVVRFRGPTHGSLVVRADPGLMRTIAENILGETDDPEPSLQLDALGEVANVICGNLLPLVDDPAAEYRLDSPLMEADEPPIPPRASVRLSIEGGVAEVILYGAVQ
jgi:hypothetical protein